ncbi:unnamed protein product, partial [marine sediment metagenome]
MVPGVAKTAGSQATDQTTGDKPQNSKNQAHLAEFFR